MYYPLYVRGDIDWMKIIIFNQWGLLVFESNSQQLGWDGTQRGVPQPEGKYVWVFQGHAKYLGDVKRQGLITLIR